MNRQGSNNTLPLWGLLLALPLLVLAIYVHLKQPPTHVISELTPPKSVVQSEEIVSLPVEAGGSVVIESSATQSHEMRTPAGLDPEAARTAVHQVENSVYDRATALFEQEPIDIEWAGAYEQSLRAMFARHEGLQRVSINSISCHTSMCRIEVFTPRDTDADFFTAMFYDGLANFRAGELKAEAAIARRMEQGITSVYVARKGHTLGFY